MDSLIGATQQAQYIVRATIQSSLVRNVFPKSDKNGNSTPALEHECTVTLSEIFKGSGLREFESITVFYQIADMNTYSDSVFNIEIDEEQNTILFLSEGPNNRYKVQHIYAWWPEEERREWILRRILDIARASNSQIALRLTALLSEWYSQELMNEYPWAGELETAVMGDWWYFMQFSEESSEMSHLLNTVYPYLLSSARYGSQQGEFAFTSELAIALSPPQKRQIMKALIERYDELVGLEAQIRNENEPQRIHEQALDHIYLLRESIKDGVYALAITKERNWLKRRKPFDHQSDEMIFETARQEVANLAWRMFPDRAIYLQRCRNEYGDQLLPCDLQTIP